jgi:hypothetical protein
MQFSTLSHDKTQIFLLFYKPTARDAYLNRLVAFWNGPYCHVEMAFPERTGEEAWEKEVWGSSIYQGETVFFKPKAYSRDGYFSFAIEVTQAQRIKIKEYCRMQSEAGVGFNLWAMYLSYLPFKVLDLDGTFCSKHVANALSVGQVEGFHNKGVQPSQMTPSSLYRMLLSRSQLQSPIVHVIPSRMTQDAGQCSAQALLEIIIKKS